MKARGAPYILVDREGQGAWSSRLPGLWLVWPKVGQEYDFGGYGLALAGGMPYNTVRHGLSSPVDVTGKRIKITDYGPGSPCHFATIVFDILD